MIDMADRILNQEENNTLTALKLLYKAKRLNVQQYKTLRGQVLAGNNEAAMQGLNRFLNRERRKKQKEQMKNK